MADPISMGLTVIGTVVSAMGTIAAGNAAAASANYNARVMEQQAGQERAASQRDAAEQRRRSAIARSNLQAQAAASGGGALDPTIVKLDEGISGEGEYRALLSMYEGENRARGLEAQAGGQRFEGRAAKSASRWSALGTLTKGAGSVYSSVGGGGSSLLDRYGDRGPTWGPYGRSGLRPY